MTALATDHGAAARGVLLLATHPGASNLPLREVGRSDGGAETRNAKREREPGAGDPPPRQSPRTVEVCVSGCVRVTDFRGDRP